MRTFTAKRVQAYECRMDSWSSDKANGQTTLSSTPKTFVGIVIKLLMVDGDHIETSRSRVQILLKD